MAAKQTTGGITAADVEAKLPRTFFVKRGDLMHAFGFTSEEITALIEQKVFKAEYPLGKTTKIRGKTVSARMRFVRSQCVAVARRWEAPA